MCQLEATISHMHASMHLNLDLLAFNLRLLEANHGRSLSEFELVICGYLVYLGT